MPVVNKNECKRYRDKIGKLQYLRDAKTQTGNSEMSLNAITNVTYQSDISKKEVSEIVERVDFIEEQYKNLIEKFESFVNEKGVPVDKTGMVAFDAPNCGKLWKEKKGLFGLGKSKWVEEKI